MPGKRPSKTAARRNLPPREIARRRARVIRLVERLPAATATAYGTHLSLDVRGKRFGWCLEDHHGDGRLALHCKAPRGAIESWTAMAPERFHIPRYVGHRGWVGLWLDLPNIDWSEVETLLDEAYRLTAPKPLLAQLRESAADC
jgi:hypothetical protein